MPGPRRRRGSQGLGQFERPPGKRYSRQSMPLVAYDGLLRGASHGLASAALELAESQDPSRPRRASAMAISLPGMSGRAFDETRRGKETKDGSHAAAGDQDGEVEEEYLFPWW
jgi:hypothetical protein